jgi:hypothetical protein
MTDDDLQTLADSLRDTAKHISKSLVGTGQLEIGAPKEEVE